MSADAPIDPNPEGTDFGQVADWATVCRAASALPPADDAAVRHFFETSFVPLRVTERGDDQGLFTGYYESELNGSRRQDGPFRVPLYRRPKDPARAGLSRDEIDAGALAGQGLELLWVDDPIDAFFLQIQGSGQVRLTDGTTVRLAYDGQNGHPYVAVGRILLDRGELPRENLSMQAIRAWMVRQPDGGAGLRRENPSYVFFRERADTGTGPLGAQGVPLTAGRSFAVDRYYLPLGAPIWLEADERFITAPPLRRLVIAQDTGGAIKGAVRGDLFWGTGTAAATRAGPMNAHGRYFVLLPPAVAARAVR
jgi:membrane-bound lytic murein transglycosylase A